jgi:cytochrome c oxidase subunit 5b
MQRLLQPALHLSRRSPIAIRNISSTLARWGEHAHKPTLFGEGGVPGGVPSDEQQATGLERLQLLGRMEGVDVFNETSLDSSRIGTLENPIIVPSLVGF